MHKTSTVLAIWLLSLGCGRSHFTEPTDVPSAPPKVVQLQAPTDLKGRWAIADDAHLAPAGHNVVVITPSYARDNPQETAERLRQRGLPAIVFAGHIYHNPESTWDASWVTFEKYLQPYKDAGVLIGIQPLDEPAGFAWGHMVPKAIANVHGHAPGLKILLTEIINYVDTEGPYKLKYSGWDWFHITCYPYPQTRWNLETCSEEYDQQPTWDFAILDDAGTNAPAWIARAEQKGRGWLVWQEEAHVTAMQSIGR